MPKINYSVSSFHEISCNVHMMLPHDISCKFMKFLPHIMLWPYALLYHVFSWNVGEGFSCSLHIMT